jgi:hypothetical protein
LIGINILSVIRRIDMPYKIEKRKNKWVIIEASTGKVVGESDSKSDAESSARARLAAEHGWKPTGKKKEKGKESKKDKK